MAGLERRCKHPIALIIMVSYWVSLLAPCAWGAQPILSMAADEPGIHHWEPQPENGTTESHYWPSEHEHVEPLIMDSVEPAAKDDACCLDVPTEGPAPGRLADLLSRLGPVVRPAILAELIDLLTCSMWSTMVIVGGIVFGLGALVLSWWVYWSVREAAQAEPVTLAFLFSIPGLRYLLNHARYHLFDTPLQPRRRFASFVGTGVLKVDLTDLEELSSTTTAGRLRKRRDSMLHPEQPPKHAGNALQQQSQTASRSRRTSVTRPVTASEQGRQSSGKTANKKRHSIALEQECQRLTPVQHAQSHPIPPPPTPSSFEISFASEPATRASSVSKITEDCHEGEQQCLPRFMAGHDDAYIAAPEPKTVSTIPHLTLAEIINDYADNESSPQASHRSSVDLTCASDASLTVDEPVRMVTPASLSHVEEEFVPNMREELTLMQADWLCTNFSSEHPERAETHGTNPPLAQSKLFRRFKEAGLEHSKLSRHFAQQPQQQQQQQQEQQQCQCQCQCQIKHATSAVNVPTMPLRLRSDPATSLNDPDAMRLHKGDLTPPPGFNHRSSRQGTFRADHALIDRTSTAPPTVAVPSSSLSVVEEAEDIILPSAAYQAAFQRRRASVIPKPSSGKAHADDDEEQSILLRRRRFRSGSGLSGLPGEDQMPNAMNWRWFIDGGENGRPLWDSSARQHGATDLYDANRTKVAPVGTGTRSLGRTTPTEGGGSSSGGGGGEPAGQPFRKASAREEVARINLGVFNDIFRVQDPAD